MRIRHFKAQKRADKGSLRASADVGNGEQACTLFYLLVVCLLLSSTECRPVSRTCCKNCLVWFLRPFGVLLVKLNIGSHVLVVARQLLAPCAPLGIRVTSLARRAFSYYAHTQLPVKPLPCFAVTWTLGRPSSGWCSGLANWTLLLNDTINRSDLAGHECFLLLQFAFQACQGLVVTCCLPFARGACLLSLCGPL